MNLEDVREYALSLTGATEDLFFEDIISFRVGGKWFMLLWLGAEEPRVAVKLPPLEGEELRDRYNFIRPAYHMNKRHWNDLYIEQMERPLVEELIRRSHDLVLDALPRALKAEILAGEVE